MAGARESSRAADQRLNAHAGLTEDDLTRMQGEFTDVLLLLNSRKEGMAPTDVVWAMELVMRGQASVMSSALKISLAVASAKAAPQPTAGPTSWAQVAQRAPMMAPGAVKPLSRREDRTIVVVRHDSTPLTGDDASPPTLTRQANEAARAATKASRDLVVAGHYLRNNNVVLVTGTAADKALLCQHAGGWVKTFGEGASLHRAQYTVMVKGVRHDALDCSSMEKARAEILRQNPRLRGRVKLLGLGFGRSRAGKKAGPLFVDLASPFGSASSSRV